MQTRRILIAGFIIVSVLAAFDFVRPTSGTFGGIFDQAFIKFDPSVGTTIPPNFEESRTLPPLAIAQGERVATHGTVGSLRVVESESSEATVSYTVKVWGTGDVAEFARSVSVSWKREDGEARLEVASPQELPRGVRAVQIDVELAVPQGTDLSIDHRGNLSVGGLSGELRLQHFGGRADVRNMRGPVSASGQYGSLAVVGAEGPVNVSIVGGEVIVRDVAGPVSGDVRFGTIEVDQAEGFVDVDIHMGAGTVDRLRGGADLSVQFGDLEVRLAPEGGWDIQAIIDMGELETNLNLQKSQSGTVTEMSGVVGDGRHPLKIEVNQGAATLLGAR